jgi:hypothetical protein
MSTRCVAISFVPPPPVSMSVKCALLSFQAIHHVKGTDYPNDGCYQYATLNNAVRLRVGPGPVKLRGVGTVLQGFEVGRYLLLCTRVFLAPIITARFKAVNTKHLFVNGQWGRGVASAFGVLWILTTSWAIVCVPLWYSKLAVPITVLVQSLVGHFWMFFFAQHTWHATIAQTDADADWGAAQTRGCYSLWGESMQFHPILWFYGNGSCPSTLTYHLEHTLFPGISYLHLPAIAPVVEQACQDHGLPYNKINGMADLRRRFKYQLEKHASSVW